MLVVGIMTLIYSTAGGLYVSLMTDQIQAKFIWLLLTVVAIYIGINFRPGPFPDISSFPSNLGVTETGWGSFVTIGLAITAGTFFSDALWQRVWSAENDKALITGAYVATFLNIFISFFFGFGGFVAAIYGLIDVTQNSGIDNH